MARVPWAFALFLLAIFCVTIVHADEIDDIIRARQDLGIGIDLPLGTGISGDSDSGTDAGTTPQGSTPSQGSDGNSGNGGNGGSGSGDGSTSGGNGGNGGNSGGGGNGSTTSTPSTTSSQPSTTTSSQPTTTSSSSSSSTTSSSQDPGTSTQIIRSTVTPSVSVETRPVTTDVVTIIGGQTSTVPITTHDLVSHTATPTAAAGLNGGGGSSSSGLSSSSKKIIGGVVGGVGGAILIAAIAFVFFRLRKRKNATYETDEDSFAKEGRSSSTPNTMFASAHADRYAETASPPTTINASSNF